MNRQISVTITVGVGSEQHNHDLDYRANLEHVHAQENGIIEINPYRDYKTQINEMLKPYIDEYNKKQQERYAAAWERYNTGQIKTKPRKANYKPISYDYYQEHKDDTYFNRKTNKQEQLPIWRSVIVGLGDKSDRDEGRITKAEAIEVLRDMIERWKKSFPNFKILGATIHLDENGFYHAHIDYKPLYDLDNGQGLAVGIGQDSALEKMGFEPEQSIINSRDKAPILFNAFRNKLYREIEESLSEHDIRLQYGVSKIKEPDKDSSKNQRLEDWQDTQDSVRELQQLKNQMLDEMQANNYSFENYTSAIDSYNAIVDKLAEIDDLPRQRMNKNNVVVDFNILDQLKSFVEDLMGNLAAVFQENESLQEDYNYVKSENEKLRYYKSTEFQIEVSKIKKYDSLEKDFNSLLKENQQLRQRLKIYKLKDDKHRGEER